MTFHHYSAEPFTFDPERPYAQQAERDKPVGLWLSVDDNDEGWKDWCKGNDYGEEGLAHRAEVTLRQKANIRYLTHAGALDEFTALFGVLVYGSAYIDWRRVTSLYDGIVIAPYIWERRLVRRTFWYYSWDCASGCIWNLKAIEVVRQEVAA